MKTVLLADDSQIMLHLIRSQFEVFGDRVSLHTATSGRSALAAWECLSPDLTILDISMPELDGPDVLDHILSAQPDAKVIMYSASRSQETRQECLSRGAIGFVVKEEQGLIPMVGRLLDITISEAA